jgi:hypothetical protein
MPTEANDGVPVKDVVLRVECELGQAVRDNRDTHRDLETWAAAIVLTLETDATGSVIPTAGVNGPWGAGKFGVSFDAGVTAKSTRTALVTASFLLKDLTKAKCPPHSTSPLSDPLGLTLWIDRALADLKDEPGEFLKKESKSLGYTVSFSVDTTAGATPGFTLTKWTGSSPIGLDRKDLNTLEIAMASGVDETTSLERVPSPSPKERKMGTFFMRYNSGTEKPEFFRRKTIKSSSTTSDRLNAILNQLTLKQLNTTLGR